MIRKIIYKSFLLIFLLNLSIISYSQKIFISSGHVLDSQINQPLIAASVRIEGSKKGTITNSDGIFKLTPPKADHSLLSSFEGYQSDAQKVTLYKNFFLEVLLKPVDVRLPETVVLAEGPAIEIIRKVLV